MRKDKRIRVTAANGMALTIKRSAIVGIGTKLNDGTFVAVELADGGRIPIHPDSGRQFINQLYAE